jgi:hypothetical protein
MNASCPLLEEPTGVGHYFTTPYLATIDIDPDLPPDILMLILDIANRPHLSTETLLLIAGYLNPVDLACFQAVNRRLRMAIGHDTRGVRVRRLPNGEQVLLHSNMDSRGKTRRKTPFPHLHVRPGLYDMCAEWTISKELLLFFSLLTQ